MGLRFARIFARSSLVEALIEALRTAALHVPTQGIAAEEFAQRSAR